MELSGGASTYTGRTAWARNLAAPVRDFLGTETGGAIVLLGGDGRSRCCGRTRRGRTPTSRLWTTKLSITIGGGGHLRRPAPLGQRGADDVLLPRRRAGGQARVRPRRAARAPPAGDPRARGARRHGGAGRDLPRLQRGRPGRARLGRGDVDRHRLRARRAGAAHAARGHAAARVPADARRGRRPLRAAGDRHRLHDPRLGPPRWRSRSALFGVLLALRYAPEWRRPVSIVGRRRRCGWRCSSRASTR